MRGPGYDSRLPLYRGRHSEYMPQTKMGDWELTGGGLDVCFGQYFGIQMPKALVKYKISIKYIFENM